MLRESQRDFIEWKVDRDIVNKVYLEGIFNSINEYEEMIGKTVENFSTMDIKGLMAWFNTFSFDRLSVVLSNLSQYTTWMINKGEVKDSQNHYEEITPADIRSYVNVELRQQKTLTRDELISFTHQLTNMSDKFLLLAIYEGIKGVGGSEILNLKTDDIDGEIFHLRDKNGNYSRDFKPSELLMRYAKASAEEDYYVFWRNDCMKVAKTLDPGYVFQGTTLNIKGRSETMLYNRLNTIKKHLSAKFTFGDLSLSGRVSFIEKRTEELGISISDYIYGVGIKELKEQFNISINKTNMYNVTMTVLDGWNKRKNKKNANQEA